MVVAQKCLQHESVLAKSVGPEIPAHEVSCRAKLLFDERQRHLGHRGIRELFHGDGLGLLECLGRLPGATPGSWPARGEFRPGA